MESNCFLDNPYRIARKLISAEGVRLINGPACYVIENKETGRIYVGSAKRISARINAHRQMLRDGQHSNVNLQNEYDRCVDENNFIIHICPTPTVEDARDREQMILDEGHSTGYLLNRADNARCPFSGYDRSAAYEKIKQCHNRPEIKEERAEQTEALCRDLKYPRGKRHCKIKINNDLIKNKIQHGFTGTSEYNIWKSIKQRTLNPKNVDYRAYGGKGITVSDSWVNSFPNFYKDMGPRPSKFHSIDRINNDGNYEPGNCRWATIEEQANNKSSNIKYIFENKEQTIAQIAKQQNISYEALRRRLSRGQSIELAVSAMKQNKVNYH